MGHGGASAWGPHLQHVVGVPVSGSCGNSGRWNLRALVGGSIHKLPCALPRHRVTLRPLGARRKTAGMVAFRTYPTSSAGRWWASFLFGGLCRRGCLCVSGNRLYSPQTSPSVGCGQPAVVAALRRWF